ncbi:MAG TPA: hypothetical protein VF628_05460 [Allosphingosinicella sp.]
MIKKFVVASGAMLACLAAPTAAFAQGGPDGSEIIGHSVQVEANGTTNTVFFDPGGNARILSAAGTEVQGRWSVANQQMCLSVGSLRECWPYQQAFQAGQPVTLTSDCAVTSRWTPVSTAPTAPPTRRGERG